MSFNRSSDPNTTPLAGSSNSSNVGSANRPASNPAWFNVPNQSKKEVAMRAGIGGAILVGSLAGYLSSSANDEIPMTPDQRMDENQEMLQMEVADSEMLEMEPADSEMLQMVESADNDESFAINNLSTDGQAPTDDAITAEVLTGNDMQMMVMDDAKTFAQAFAEARADMGPGGAFLWHGNIYATYYAEEWETLDEEQRNDFAQNFNWDRIDHTNSNMAEYIDDNPQLEMNVDSSAAGSFAETSQNTNANDVQIMMDGKPIEQTSPQANAIETLHSSQAGEIIPEVGQIEIAESPDSSSQVQDLGDDMDDANS